MYANVSLFPLLPLLIQFILLFSFGMCIVAECLLLFDPCYTPKKEEPRRRKFLFWLWTTIAVCREWAKISCSHRVWKFPPFLFFNIFNVSTSGKFYFRWEISVVFSCACLSMFPVFYFFFSFDFFVSCCRSTWQAINKTRKAWETDEEVKSVDLYLW